MDPIEKYAVWLVVTGAEESAMVDLNENDEPLEDGEWRAACRIGRDMAAAISADPQAFLRWYHSLNRPPVTV